MPSPHATADATRLRRSVSSLSRRLRAQDESNTIGPTGLAILGRLLRTGVVSAAEVAQAEHLDPPSLMRAVEALAEAGYVDRWADEDDRCRTSLAITAAGEAYLSTTMGRRVQWLAAAMESRLDPAERDTLRTATRLIERLSGGGRNRARPADLIFNLIPSTRVADVQRSLTFYEHLGFVVDGRSDVDGTLVWASMHARLARSARIMFFACDDGAKPPSASAQGTHFYCWTDDAVTLRARLMNAGLEPGNIAHPPHMPDGEFALTDPDGYRLLVGQVTRTDR